MPAITLDKPAIAGLKTNKIFNNADYTYLALRFDKDPNNSTQVVDADTFSTSWGIDNQTLFAYLASLEAKKIIKINPSRVTVTWTDPNETTGMGQTEVLKMYSDGLISAQTYVYYALLLNKPAGATQIVDPATYSVAPWSINSATLMAQLNAIASKKDTNSLPIIKLDLATVSIVWLM